MQRHSTASSTSGVHTDLEIAVKAKQLAAALCCDSLPHRQRSRRRSHNNNKTSVVVLGAQRAESAW